MSEAIATSIVGAVVSCFLAWIAYRQQQMKVLADQTHNLVNNQYGVSLHVGATLSREKANRTNDPGDIKAAEYAEYLLDQHVRQQHVADLKAVSPPPVP